MARARLDVPTRLSYALLYLYREEVMVQGPGTSHRSLAQVQRHESCCYKAIELRGQLRTKLRHEWQCLPFRGSVLLKFLEHVMEACNSTNLERSSLARGLTAVRSLLDLLLI